ncbi:MAG: dihydrodipicolinate synthase family protein [Anaerolineae bacterium]|nr:dihydrodipicolinate synthase family protein [Thermoflexales bacterium]MDW8408994.1 dihydrodipicolinate synthase family protein [Anaerolineae bacterium]
MEHLRGLKLNVDDVRRRLMQGMLIPAHPLALNAARKLDERRQRALSRYYIEAGSGGLAVGVHTTQFAIRRPEIGLYRPVLCLAAEIAAEYAARPLLIAGVVGSTSQAVAEAELAAEIGYDAVLLSLSGLGCWTESHVLAHCRVVAEVLPVMGFYLQPAVGGIPLSYSFWRRFVEIESVVAIKVAPFNRYATLDVARAVIDAGRQNHVALYTGNDDAILSDLLLPFNLPRADGQPAATRFVGGLLGHCAVWTRTAVRIFEYVQSLISTNAPLPVDVLQLAWQITDCNSAFFDAANAYRGCIAGLHEVLRRQGLLEGIWCIDPDECLSPGQFEEIDRVYRAYPHLNDDEFVAEHRDRWLS